MAPLNLIDKICESRSLSIIASEINGYFIDKYEMNHLIFVKYKHPIPPWGHVWLETRKTTFYNSIKLLKVVGFTMQGQ